MKKKLWIAYMFLQNAYASPEYLKKNIKKKKFHLKKPMLKWNSLKVVIKVIHISQTDKIGKIMPYLKQDFCDVNLHPRKFFYLLQIQITWIKIIKPFDILHQVVDISPAVLQSYPWLKPAIQQEELCYKYSINHTNLL